MAVAPPSYCFVAFPPRAKDGLVVFGKNSARPRDEVQEVVYFPAADHEPESKVEEKRHSDPSDMDSQILVNVRLDPSLITRETNSLLYLYEGKVQLKSKNVNCQCHNEKLLVLVKVPWEESAMTASTDSILSISAPLSSPTEFLPELHCSLVLCTYISIDQVPRTHSIMISRPAWLWGAEMGANEHGVCIANEAINAKEPAAETEALLGMDLVRLGLERGTTAKEALDVIVALLEEHGQGGNYYEDANSYHSFQSAYLIVDREEAWVLETIGKYWAAEQITEGVKCICNQLSLTTKIDAEHPELRSYAQRQGWWTGQDEFNFSEVFSPADDHLDCGVGKESLEKQEENITVQTMIEVLRDKASGVCIDSESFLTTASAVSVLPQNRSLPCIHYFTGTPDPSRSIFKPFIFVDDVKLVPKVQSPCFGHDDPAKKEPRFQEKPDRRHELYKAHEWARVVLEGEQEEGHKLRKTMLELEKQGLEAMEEILTSSEPLDPTEVGDLFYDCVDTEIKFFK